MTRPRGPLPLPACGMAIAYGTAVRFYLSPFAGRGQGGHVVPNRTAVIRTHIIVSFALLVGAISTALAQTFPTHGVTIISPYQAGGTSDIIARVLAEKLGETWSQPVVVENRPGANGAIGVQSAARAPADGHTLLEVASSALTLNATIFPNPA